MFLFFTKMGNEKSKTPIDLKLTKRCKECLIELSLEKFDLYENGCLGRKSTCKKCSKIEPLFRGLNAKVSYKYDPCSGRVYVLT